MPGWRPTCRAAGLRSPTPGCALAATGIGYQHYWAPTLRSTIAYGIARYQVPARLVGPVEDTVANKQLQSASLNLVWSPVGFIDIGAEYFWGQCQVLANLVGNEQVLIGKFRVKY
jgi:DcaP outer membrane protein